MQQDLGDFFYSKVLNAVRIIEEARVLFGEIALSYNGGKDCTVLLEIIEYFSIDIPVVVFSEPNTFLEIIHFAKERLKKSRVRHFYLSDNIGLELKYLVANGVKGVVLGQRSLDPARPTGYYEQSTPGWEDYVRIFPIFNWTYQDIWYFIDYTNTQYCSLYSQGYTSIGSIYTTIPNPKLLGRHARELLNEHDERLGRI